ncbi:16S rRNA (guanine(527)-N(7))-methyltransferase RsmG [Thermosulfurimonas marina]|uniref:16S rRNA (guanine(527)-N(7))-methyltransferase RsmG n=1 Tax=Thermosulfurimonas marina TaxID=2047767 RepID=UPI00144AA892|nr:16S rRNA (guanine(527)-N(7))-methyltransferase RsmG [Thermosulfurimonas marina]
MTEEAFWREARRLVPGLGPPVLEKLLLYADLLQEMAHPLGLLGTATRGEILAKHLLDSLVLVPHLPPTGKIADLGSGAGLPGLVLKIVRPDLEVWLVEPRRRAVSFLEYAAARLGLSAVKILRARAEDPEVPRAHFEAVTARAVSELIQLWSLAEPLLLPQGRLLALKAAGKLDRELQTFKKAFPGVHLQTHPYRLPGRQKGVVVEVFKGSPN